MAGSGAVVGVMASTGAIAGVRQITLSANQITSGGANTLSADVTGDGVADLPYLQFVTTTNLTNTYTAAANFYYRNRVLASVFSSGPGVAKLFGSARLVTGFTSNVAETMRYSSFTSYSASAGSNASNGEFNFNSGTAPQSVNGLTAITFTDPRINGGAPTEAFVDTRAFNSGTTAQTVQLVRTIFNDANVKVPPGIQPHVTYKEFDPTVYAQRAQLENKIKKLKKKSKKLKNKNKQKSKKLNKKAKKLSKKLAAIA